MIFCKLCTNFALACTTDSDDDKDPLPVWRRRSIEKEHLSKSLTELSTSSIERTDAGYLPSNGALMIYGRVRSCQKCKLLSEIEGLSVLYGY